MIDLAIHNGNRPVYLRKIALRQGISFRYLQNIFSMLKSAGYVTTLRGAGGGFYLARDPADISLKNIIELLEGPLCIVDCVDHPKKCVNSGLCSARDVWMGIAENIRKYLDGISLKDMIENAGKKRAIRQTDFQI